MYKKIQCKSFVSMFLVALMILTTGDTGLFGMKKVFAKANGKDDELVKIEENNIITSEEIENMDVRSIINKIQSQSVGISSIRVVNDLNGIQLGDEIEFEVHDELGQKISVDNLVFIIGNEKLGKMDDKAPNKFIKMGEDTVVIKVTLKDRPNIKDEIII